MKGSMKGKKLTVVGVAAVMILSAMTAMTPVGGTDVTNNGAPSASVSQGATNVSILNFTVEDGGDSVLLGDGISAGNSVIGFNNGTAERPELYVDNSSTYKTSVYNDEDDILNVTRLTDAAGNLSNATVRDFYGSVSYLSPAGNGFDGSQAIVNSSDDTLQKDDIIKKGGNDVLTNISSSNPGYQHWDEYDDGTQGGYDGDGSGGYGEAIYNSSGDGAVDVGDSRVTNATIYSGNDTDPATVDLGYGTFYRVESSHNDIGKPLTPLTNAQVMYNESSGDSSYDDGDTTFIDLQGDGYYNQSTDIVLIDNTGDGGLDDETDGIALSGSWTTGTYYNVVYDVGSNGPGTKPDIEVSGGSATYSSLTFYGTEITDAVRFWDWNNDSGVFNTTGASADTEGVYIDEDASATVSKDDFRMRNFTVTKPAGTDVGIGDVDVGVSVVDFSSQEWFLDDNNNGSYQNGEALIYSDDKNLDSSDQVNVTGTIADSRQPFNTGDSGNAEMYVDENDSGEYDNGEPILYLERVTSGASPEALDGKILHEFAPKTKHGESTANGAYDDGEAIIDDADDNGIYQDRLENVYISNNYTGGLKITDGQLQAMELKDGNATATSIGTASWYQAGSQWNITGIDQAVTTTQYFTVTMDIAADADGNRGMNATGTIDLASKNTTIENGYNQTLDAPPAVIDADTVDNDDNGIIDNVTVTYSDTMQNYGPNDLTIEGRGQPYDATATTETYTNDTITYGIAGGNQSATADGGETPLLTFNTGNIQDDEGDDLLTASYIPSDGVSPVITEFEGQVGADTATVMFSEPVYANDNKTGAITTANLTYSGPGLLMKSVSHLANTTMAVVTFNGQVNSSQIDSQTINVSDSDQVYDAAENPNGALTAAVTMADTREALSLTKGWNLISLPDKPNSGWNLSQNSTHVDQIFTYDNNDWKSLGDITAGDYSVDTLTGVFIHATEPTELELWWRADEPYYMPPTKNLEQGWNLVGPNMDTSTEINVSIPSYLNSVAGSWSTLFSPGYNLNTWTHTANEDSPGDKVLAYEGYWVYMTADGTLAGRTA